MIAPKVTQKLTTFLIIASLVTSVSRADVSSAPRTEEATNSIYLIKGAITPYEGFLLSKEQALKIKSQLEESDDIKNINVSLTKIRDLYKNNSDIKDQQINTLLDQNNKLVKSISDTQVTANWDKYIYFGLGVLATGLAFYATKKVTQIP